MCDCQANCYVQVLLKIQERNDYGIKHEIRLQFSVGVLDAKA